MSFSNCPECIWTLAILLLGALLIGGIIGWIIASRKRQTKLNVSTGSASATATGSASVESDALRQKSNALTALETRYAKLESRHQKLNEELLVLKSKASSSAPKADTASAESRRKREEEILLRIKSQAREFDFNRIGKASPDEKDNLKRLQGLGWTAEKRLNALGFFSFRQIAQLDDADQAKLNEVLGYPKDKVQRSNWVMDAKKNLGLISEEEIILDKIRSHRNWINFDRLGSASEAEKDDLQRINGIGPYIEDRLNALGIFTFAQLAKANPRDVAMINQAVELDDGHIKRDDWITQAKKFIKEKAS